MVPPRNGVLYYCDQKAEPINMKASLGCFLLFMFCSAHAFAADSWGKNSLSSVDAVSKISISMAYCETFLFKSTLDLQRDAAQKLAIGQVLIDSEADPWLLMNISCVPVRVGTQQLGYAIQLQLTLYQMVIIEKTKLVTLAATWQNSDSRICSPDSCSEAIRESAKDSMDSFLLDRLKSHQTK